MHFSEYIPLAMRTAPILEGRQQYLELARIGMIGELGEIAEMIKKSQFHNKMFTREQAIKECGDLTWYIAVYCNYTNMSIDPLIPTTVFSMSMTQTCNKMVNLVSIICNDGLERSYHAVYDLLFEIHRIAVRFESSISEVLDTNIEKLKRRYPGGFDIITSANHDSE